MNSVHLQSLSKRGGAAMQTKQRASGAEPQHLNVAPSARVTQARAYGLEERLLGRKANGQRRNGVTQAQAVLQFGRGKKTYQAPLTVPLVKAAHAWNRDQVKTGTQYH